MEKKFLWVALLLASLVMNVGANANTQFVKYKKYLIPINTQKQLAVETNNATNISVNSAILNLTLRGGESQIRVWFEFSSSSQPACAQSAPANSALLNIGESYQFQETGLSPNSTYYFVACASNDLGEVSVGNIRNFITLKAPTIVRTGSANNVSQFSARLSGEIVSGTDITTWFVHGQTSAIQCQAPLTTSQNNGNSGQFRSVILESLFADSRYYYRFCGLGSDGVKSGELRFFFTPKETDVETLDASSISQTSATLRGQIVEGNSITTWFVYGDNPNLVCDDPVNPVSRFGSTGQTKTRQISSLSQNSEYYYLFCGQGSDGTKSGVVEPFTTLPDATVLSFVGINRSDSSATLQFRLDSGQNVKTWYVVGPSSSSQSCTSSPKRGERTLDSGESNIYTVSGLSHWTWHRATFCAQGVDGTVDSISRGFLTKRKDGFEYVVSCNDARVFSSVNGPLKFYVTTPPPAFPSDDHATFTIYNNGGSRQYSTQSRTGFNTTTIPNGKWGPIAIDPAFNSGDRFYRLQIFGSGAWEAKVGCITANIFKSFSDEEDDSSSN